MNNSGSSNGRIAIKLRDLTETATFGRRLGELALPGDVILLRGTLGAGKTTLTQFIAQGLAVPSSHYVTSPSFNLLHEYPGRLPLYHIDCYRLTSEDEVEDAGLTDYLVTRGVTVIEWPERLGSLVPQVRLELIITPCEGSARQVIVIAHGETWRQRYRQLAAGFSLLPPT